MIEIAAITPSSITLKGIEPYDYAGVEKIMDICHKYKHMYNDGYPCGRKARKKLGKRLKKWAYCPEICFVYLLKQSDESLIIRILVSDYEGLLKKYSIEEIEHYRQMFTQNIADEIMSRF